MFCLKSFCFCFVYIISFLLFTGTASPQAVRKLMSLSEPGKTRQRRAKHSVSSLHSINSPPGSPPPTNAKKVKGHERSQSDCSVTQPVSLSAESSSVTSLPARKHLLSHAIGKSFKSYFDGWQAIVTRRLSPGSLVWLLTYPTRQPFNSIQSQVYLPFITLH